MDEDELRKHSTCDLCGKRILASGLPLFWRVTVERFGVDVQACKRQDALAAMIGSAAIASVMSPERNFTVTIGEPKTITVCEPCGTERSLPIAALVSD